MPDAKNDTKTVPPPKVEAPKPSEAVKPVDTEAAKPAAEAVKPDPPVEPPHVDAPAEKPAAVIENHEPPKPVEKHGPQWFAVSSPEANLTAVNILAANSGAAVELFRKAMGIRSTPHAITVKEHNASFKPTDQDTEYQRLIDLNDTPRH